MTELVRLSKRLIEHCGCSRREAELYIEGGWVRVAGVIVDQPQFMVGDQLIELDKSALAVPTEAATLLLHKPLGVHCEDAKTLADLVTETQRWEGDETGIRPLPRHFLRQFPLLSLEQSASGLLALTQDGRVARRMNEEGHRIEQEWVVEVSGSIINNGLQSLNTGLRHEEGRIAPCKVSWQSETRLRFAIKDVQDGQLPWMCERVGLTVISMKRLRIGRIPLAQMEPGQWRYLPAGERF
jgi:23S rRNA pseudouridine2604 synthase